MTASNENDQPTLSIVPATASDPSAANELLDEGTLARCLGVSRSTLQSWRYTGRGPRFIKLGRMVRYRSSDVDAYLRTNTRGRVA